MALCFNYLSPSFLEKYGIELPGSLGLGLDERHGGPFDRGSADAYYGREFNPHKYDGKTYSTPRIGLQEMTKTEIAEYAFGYITQGDKKQW